MKFVVVMFRVTGHRDGQKRREFRLLQLHLSETLDPLLLGRNEALVKSGADSRCLNPLSIVRISRSCTRRLQRLWALQ
jgi:hypothetical protein